MRATQHFECCVRQATRPGQHANGARSEQAGHQGRGRGVDGCKGPHRVQLLQQAAFALSVSGGGLLIDHAEAEADPLKIVKCSPSVSIFGSYQFKNLESKLEVGT